MTRSELINKLIRILTAKQVLTDLDSRRKYSQDKWPRWLFSPPNKTVDAVVCPNNAQEVAKVLAFAYQEKIPVIPYGGGSGVCGAVRPDKGGIAVDMKRLNSVQSVQRDFSADQAYVIADSGVIGEALERSVNAEGFTLGHFPASMAISTAGGWVAAESSGQCSTKYGNIESLLEEIEVVLPDGKIIWVSGKRLQPFIGSEGTLGIITAVKLKVFPAGNRKIFMSFAFHSLSEALSACSRMSRLPEKPAVLRVYDSLDRLFLGPGKESSHSSGSLSVHKNIIQQIKFWFLGRPKAVYTLGSALGRLPFWKFKPLLIVIFDNDDNSGEPERMVKSIAWLNRGKYLGENEAILWWQERYKLNFQKIEKYFQLGIFANTLDVAAAVDQLPALYKAMVGAMSPYAVALAHFSHFFGDRGCIYFTLIGRAGDQKKSLQLHDRAWAAGLEACRKAGGEVTHHHGIGIAKLPWFEMPDNGRWGKWRKLKAELDPYNIMNPGRLVKN